MHRMMILSMNPKMTEKGFMAAAIRGSPMWADYDLARMRVCIANAIDNGDGETIKSAKKEVKKTARALRKSFIFTTYVQLHGKGKKARKVLEDFFMTRDE